MKQHTLKRYYSFEGKGLHTGQFAHLTLKPAGPDTGIVFVRTDIGPDAALPALGEYVSDTSRSTTLSDGAVEVHTVEHLLSALTGLGVDNAVVEIDNLCQIAHNVQIGDNTVMAAQCGIAGSTKIGKNCILAGQVGIVGHVTIADGTTICAQAGVIGNIRKSGQVVFGSPAIDRQLFLKSYALFKKAGEEK